MTVNLSSELQEQAKDAYWQVRGDYRTFSDWVAEALVEKIEQTRQRAGLEEVPKRPGGGLPTGRPLS